MFLFHQDDYTDAMAKLAQTVSKAHAVKSDIKFEVFIHKVGQDYALMGNFDTSNSYKSTLKMRDYNGQESKVAKIPYIISV